MGTERPSFVNMLSSNQFNTKPAVLQPANQRVGNYVWSSLQVCIASDL